MSSFRSSKVIRQYRFLEVDPPVEAPAEESAPEVEPEEDVAGPQEVNLPDAREEAERILRAAREEVEAVRERALQEGWQEGFESGRAEGLRTAEAESSEQATRLRSVVDRAIEQRASLLVEAEGELVDLALAISRKVIGDAAAQHVGVIVEMAHQAIAVLGQPETVQLHVNPHDAERLADYWKSEGVDPGWELVPDERLTGGGCTITSGASVVDARPETQLELIQQAFRRGRGNP